MPKEAAEDSGLRCTVIRGVDGRPWKGSRALNADSPKRRLTFAALVRKRFDDTEDGRARMDRILDHIEALAMGQRGANARAAIQAFEVLAKLRDGSRVYEGDPAVIDVAPGAPAVQAGDSRRFLDPAGVKELHGQIASALGVEPDEVSGLLERLMTEKNKKETEGR